MLAILYALGMFVADLFKSHSRLEAENLFLRHQLTLTLRQKRPRIRLRGSDRALLVWMVRLWPKLLDTRLHHSRHGDGHPRPADLSWIAVAKWNCRTFDRHAATRVRRPNADLWRVAPAAHPFFVYGVLGIAERCAPAPSSPTVWCYC